MIFCLIYVQLFRKCIFLLSGNLDVFTYAVTKEMRGASSTRLRRQSSLDQWMIPNVMKFILFRTIPLNKTAKERGSSLSNVCSVFVRWRGTNQCSERTQSPPALTVAVKDTPCLPRTCSEENSSSYVQCERCWDLHLFCITKVVITVRTHFAGKVSRTPIPVLCTQLTNCYCLGVSMFFCCLPD